MSQQEQSTKTLSLDDQYQEICFRTGTWIYASQMAELQGDKAKFDESRVQLARLKVEFHQWQGRKNLIEDQTAALAAESAEVKKEANG